MRTVQGVEDKSLFPLQAKLTSSFSPAQAPSHVKAKRSSRVIGAVPEKNAGAVIVKLSLPLCGTNNVSASGLRVG